MQMTEAPNPFSGEDSAQALVAGIVVQRLRWSALVLFDEQLSLRPGVKLDERRGELRGQFGVIGVTTRSVQNCTLTRTGNEIMKLGDFTNVRLGMDWQDDGLPRLFAFRTLF